MVGKSFRLPLKLAPVYTGCRDTRGHEVLLKSVKFNQLLDNPAPCLSFYVRDADGLAQLEESLAPQLQRHPELQALYAKSRPAMYEILRRQGAPSHGFFLSATLAGHIALGYHTADHVGVGEHFHLRPLLEDVFADPDYALVVLDETEMRLYAGNGRRVEFLEALSYGNGAVPQRVYGTVVSLAAQRHRTPLKQLAMRLLQSPTLAQLPVVVAGDPNLCATFLRFFEHPFGVVATEGADWARLTCPQLVVAGRTLRPRLVEIYSAHFRQRLKNLLRGGRLVSETARLLRAVGDGNVSRLLLPHDSQLWGRVDLASGTLEVDSAVSPGARDVYGLLARQVVKDGGQIQFLPAHFFPHGAHAMVILREAPSVASFAFAGGR